MHVKRNLEINSARHAKRCILLAMGKKVKVVRIVDVTEMGRAGGKARAANLGADGLSAAGKHAAAARWAGHKAKRPASSRKKAR
jgi:hypothetical protein